MDYEVHIRDTENIQDPLILHYAERSSIALNWLGGDDKTQPIVGSELNFTLEVLDGEDGKYDQYFTSNEKRWEVTKVLHSTQEVIWRGYLLPESYSEPYAYPAFYVNFSATDGLGLLKGKKLPLSFYDEEKKVTAVICEALKLTGLDFDVFLAPAIRNQLNKKWHQVIIDTKKYYDKDTLPSAYELLEEIIFSMRCQLYQADERWYIEGITKRQLINLTYDCYSIKGDFKGGVAHTKNVKVLSFSPTPNITMVPPFKEVVVTHEAAQLELPKEVYNESNAGWRVSNYAQNNYYIARHWSWGVSGYKALIVSPDQNLLLQNISQDNSIDLSKTVLLKNKPYILKGWRVKLNIEFELKLSEDISNPSEALMEQWRDIVGYMITLDGGILYNNVLEDISIVESLNFDNSKKAELEFTFNAAVSGFLGVRLYEPYGNPIDTKVSGVFLTKLEVENVNQVEDYVAITTIDAAASSTKEIELPISDDVSALSKSFYLEPVRALTAVNPIYEEVDVLDMITYQGEKYYIVSLLAAVLIDEHKEFVTYDTTIIPDFFNNNLLNVEVFFNWLGSELMTIKADVLTGYTPLKFRIEVRKTQGPSIARTQWLKWTDDIYQVEEKPYAQVVAEIEKKLFEKQHLRIEGDCHNPVKFNDVIRFKWQDENLYFSPTNCSWNVDESISSIILVENIYAGLAYGNLPPFVTTGETLYLASNASTIYTIGQNAFDPDGSLVSLTWEKLIGDQGVGIAQNSNTSTGFHQLVGDYYKFRLTAIDNGGSETYDDLEIFRNLDILLNIRKTSSSYEDYKLNEVFEVTLNPNLPADFILNLTYDVTLKVYASNLFSDLTCQVTILKEANNYFYQLFNSDFAGDSAYLKQENEMITMSPGSSFTVLTSCGVDALYATEYSRATIDFKLAEFVSGNGNVSNLPQTIETEYTV